jgi:hypothetical protein
MARTPPRPPPKGSPDGRFRTQIETALLGGAAPNDLILRLTLRDATLLVRDPATPVADISFAGGVMRFLGVLVEKGGVSESVLDHRTS